jgi:peptidoglycan/xylan/chitin deacetylase (PgdA/CDA1 family)
VALTFDDGPGPYTHRILASLARAHARATFFVVGSRVASYAQLTRAEVRAGAVGNHSWSHPHLEGLGRRAVYGELARTQAAIVRAGVPRPSLFRPPYEVGTPASRRVTGALGLLDVRWSVDSGDAEPGATSASIAAQVKDGLRPGAIVLMHDIHAATAAALPTILREVRRRGLRPVTVPELVALDPPSRSQLVPLRPSGRCA